MASDSVAKTSRVAELSLPSDVMDREPRESRAQAKSIDSSAARNRREETIIKWQCRSTVDAHDRDKTAKQGVIVMMIAL
jgi:hypothetical protein